MIKFGRQILEGMITNKDIYSDKTSELETK